jgi:opine dehydrogenase
MSDIRKIRKITVLGAGNGGQTMAGHLAAMGHRVVLFEHPDFLGKIQEIEARGRRVALTGALSAEGVLHGATTDPQKAVQGAEVLFFVAPTFAQKPIFNLILPHLEEGQTLIVIPGNFGSLVLRRMMGEKGIRRRVFLAETDTLPYACRLVADGESNVWGLKDFVALAALPGGDYEAVTKNLEGVFPVRTTRLPHVLAAGLSNSNLVIHCPTMLMNAGRIESEKGAFRFYTDGMSPAVCRVQEALDAERIALGRALGATLQGTAEKLKGMYRLSGGTLHQLLAENPAYGQHGNDAPKDMKHRYFNEDVPYLLAPLSVLGDLVGCPTPVTDSILLLAGLVNEVDYLQVGWNLKELGLSGLSVEEILKKL